MKNNGGDVLLKERSHSCTEKGEKDLKASVDTPEGLGTDEVNASRIRYGNNTLRAVKKYSFLKKLIESFSDPIIRVLLIALAVTVVIPNGNGGGLDAIGIAIAVLLATFVSTLCEYGSEKAFRRMQRDAGAQRCTVIRSGATQELPISDVVVGDVVELRAGETIPADGILTFGALSCDQSALNGESVEKHKRATAVYGDIERIREVRRELGDGYSLFRGSAVTAGGGRMTVAAVGEETYYGKMAVELQDDGGVSPLKLKLTKLAKTLSKFGYCCAFVVGVSNLLFNTVFSETFVFGGLAFLSALLKAVTLAVSVVVMAVPEGLPMMITVVLSSNMFRMQKEHVMVRKLVGIETAGSVNILFTDKTGTLTKGRPEVSGYACAHGKFSRLREVDAPVRELIAMASGFAASSVLETERSTLRARAVGGDVTDRAVMDAAAEYIRFENVRRVEFFPFNSTDKLCAATVSIGDGTPLALKYGNRLTLIKGAPEVIIERCEYIISKDGSKSRIDKTVLKSLLSSLAISGARVLALACSDPHIGTVSSEAENAAANRTVNTGNIFNDASFISFICIRDELRPQSAKAVKELQGAGIQTVMITGDSPLTAGAIAREVGILPKRSGENGASGYGRYAVLLGEEISAMSDAELVKILSELRVIARALPQDKSRLVRLAKERGYVVAMTGDGLNDAPALKLADVGFAMGSGTDVAKEAGDIVITDNNIASIVSAVLYGRTVFRSIRKFIVFQLTMNLCAVGVSIIAPFIGFETPITVMQMLWINIIIDTLAALAFSGEAPMKSYMKEPPTPRDEPVLSSAMMAKIFTLGSYTLMLCIYFLITPKTAAIFRSSENDKVLLTGLFALFIFSGIIGGFNARTDRLNLFSGLLINPVFLAVMCGVFTAQVVMIYYGGAAFDTVPLNIPELLYVFKLAFTVIIAGRLFEVAKRIFRIATPLFSQAF